MWQLDWTQFAIAWQSEWSIPAAGVAAAVLAFGIGGMLFRSTVRRRSMADKNLHAAPIFQGSPPEHRAALRRSGNSVGILLQSPNGGPEQTGWVVDRSVGGLCLHLSSPLEVGTTCSVKPSNAPSNLPWVPVEVRTCNLEGGTWKVGCQFLKTPTWNIMMLFG
jgi:hypothetical protein